MTFIFVFDVSNTPRRARKMKISNNTTGDV